MNISCSISARATIEIPHNKLSEDVLIHRLKLAWIRLRIKYPILALQIKQGPVYQYKHTSDDDTIMQWVKDTTQTYHIQSSCLHQDDLHKLRDDESRQSLPDEKGNEAQLWFILAKTISPPKEVALNLRLNHALLDGDSMPILMSEYLQLLDDLICLSDVAPYATVEHKDTIQQQIPLLPAYLEGSLMKFKGEKVDFTFYGKIMDLCQSNMSLTSRPTPSSYLQKSRHSRILFDELQSKLLLDFARKHDTTVSPIFAAVIQVRLALTYSTQWPIPIDVTHSDFFPVNGRPAMLDPRRVGMSVGVHGSIMYLGQALHHKTRQQVEQKEEYKDIILSLAREVDSSYRACKEAQFRANLVTLTPSLVDTWDRRSQEKTYDMKAVASRYYSDGKQDVYFPSKFKNLRLTDYDMDVHNTKPVL
jgi:hypothetical protein